MDEKSDAYVKRTFDFFEALSYAEDETEIANLLIEELKLFGFEYVTVWSMPPPGSLLDGINLNTRPAEYVDRYVEKKYVLTDPVVTYLRKKRVRPYSWSDVRNNEKLTRQQSNIIDEASEFDVFDGLIVPIVTATGSLSIVSPCGRAPDLSPRARSAVEFISVMGHQALKRSAIERYKEQEASDEPIVPLTPREREVMQLVATGKSDIEIGQILHISDKTVLAHVENAKAKLGSAKRSLAVVTALKRGELYL